MTKTDAKARLLEAAGKIFAAEGFEHARVRQICRAAEVNGASVNYYFGDKQRLYIEAVKHARSQIDRRWPMPEFDPGRSPEENLRQFVRTLLQRLMSEKVDEWRVQLIMREVMHPSGACEEMVQESFHPFFDQLLTTIAAFFSYDVPRDRLYPLGFSLIAQCVFYRSHKRIAEMMIPPRVREQRFHMEALVEHITKFSVAAIRAAAALPGDPVASADSSVSTEVTGRNERPL